MARLPQSLSAAVLAAVLAACVAVAGVAQNAPPASNQTGVQQPTAKTAAEASKDTKELDALLAKTAALYYSTTKAGLTGFDCAVHPDWRLVFLQANPGTAVAADDPRVALLQSVKITLHVKMKGGATLEWVPPSPAAAFDKEQTELLDRMHQATEQTMQGFIQFWTPFMDGSVVPASTEGLEVKRQDKGFTVHGEDGSTTLTEVFSNEMILEQFNVVLNGTSIKFSPAYKTMPGRLLLVNDFRARILPAGATPVQEQNMHVGVEYQTVGGFPIPGKLAMEVAGTGSFNTVLDGCQVNAAGK